MYQRFSTSRDSNGERAVTEVLGAILVFGLVLAVLALVQVSGIPAANEQIEFEHSQFVQQDLQELGSAIDRGATTGSGETVPIQAGADYPNRLLFVSPGPVPGSVSVSPASDKVGISNAVAISRETDEYWSGTASEVDGKKVQQFDTSLFQYRVDYNYYEGAPISNYEHGILYDEFESAGDTQRIVRGGGDVIQGRQISLITIEGDLSTSTSDTVALNVVPLSGPIQRTSIANNDDGPIEIQLPTNLDQEDWDAILLSEKEARGGYVTGVSVGSGVVTITLKEDVTYDLRMARVGLGDSSTPEEPYYLTEVRGSNAKVLKGESQELVVEARDRYNNPVSGVEVTFTDPEPDDGTFQNEVGGEVTVTTDENGRATALFTPANSQGPISVAALAGDLGDAGTDENDHERVDFQNVRADSGGIAGDINPDESGRVKLVSASSVNQGEGPGDKIVTLTFTSDPGQSVTIVGGRVNFHSAGGPGGSGGSSPEWLKIDGSPQLDVGGKFKNFDGSTSISSDTAVNLEWEKGIKPDHFYVLTLEFSNGDTGLYFVSHPAKATPQSRNRG